MIRPHTLLLLAASTGSLLMLAGCQQEPPGSTSTQEPAAASDAADITESAEVIGDASAPEARLQFVAPNLTEEELRDGWVSLFDGVSLFGWDVPEDSDWHVEDGCLVAAQEPASLLTTPFQFDDFELRCDFHLESGGNSGVFLRTAESPQSPATDTWELNICDSHESYPTGSLVARHQAGDVPPVEGAWHTFRVRCEGPRIEVWLDGESIVDFTDESENARTTGTIGLQMNGGRIAFRNIFLKPVGSRELFNGESLDGWSEVDGSKSRFEVVDGAIHVTNGPGFLQTDADYDDFMLHVEARTNGEALNSGVFFRAMPGTAEAPSHGYEMQIQNGFRNDDRTQPADSGTGAIFRRAAARYVVGSDHEWLTATLIAQGDRFATWVNGYQVVYWQDDRDPNENPRRGRRLEAGRFSLQGHDPTTDLDFRAVRIHEFAAE